jgi:exopolysaccharide biosynthesis predicted pyruvyltransferase EpsI
MTTPFINVDGLRHNVDKTLRALGVAGASCALLDFPSHSNIGDSLIWLGAVASLRRVGAKIRFSSAMSSSSAYEVPSGVDRILLNGGGNFGDLWVSHQEYRVGMAERFPDKQFIQLPQSVWFNDPDSSIAQRTAAVLESGSLLLIVRDNASADRVEDQFGIRPPVCPDLALTLASQPRRVQPSCDVIQLLRDDEEAVTRERPDGAVDWRDAPAVSGLERIHFSLASRISRSPIGKRRLPSIDRWAHDSLAELRVQRGVDLLSRGRRLETDRLHAAVLGLQMGMPVTVRDNSYGKVHELFNTWSSFIEGFDLASSP